MTQAQTWKERHTSDIEVNGWKQTVIHSQPEEWGATLMPTSHAGYLYRFEDDSEVLILAQQTGGMEVTVIK